MADTPPSEQPTQALTGGQVARATLVVMIGFILSRALGLVRESITAGLFGTGLAVDAFGAASRPPETIFLVVAGGAIGSAFIPTFMTYVADNKRDEAYRLTSTIINLLLIGMIVLCGVVAIFARPIAGLLVLGHADPAAQPLTADLLRIMLVTPAIYGVSGLMMGFLQAHQRFLLPALAPAFRNLGVIAGAVFLAPTMGIYGLAWGAVLGAGLHFLVQLPGIVATRYPYRPLLDLKHPGVRRVARLMGPRVIGLAVATAVFPTFAAQVSEGKTADLRRTLGQVLRAVLFLSLPSTVGLIVLRVPLIRLLFERGEFTATDTQAPAWALLFFALGLVSHSLVEVITRAFYALHDTRTPVLIGGGAMLLNVILSLSLIRVIGDPGDLARGAFAGLALANTLATTLEGVALLVGSEMARTFTDLALRRLRLYQANQ